ncbi:MAG: apolipoprotein N-acyltransferase [Thermoanaerobaculia bacterium]
MPFRILLSILSGVLFALAFPPYGYAFLAFVALIPLLFAVVRTPGRREAFLLGWLSQTVAWLLMVPFVIRAMTHYGGLPRPLGVLLYVVMALILGFYGGVFALVVRVIQPGIRFVTWLTVPLAWAALEYARTYLLGGFAWNLLATSIADYTPLVQLARAAGPYFLGALMIFPATVVVWWVTQKPPAIAKVIVTGILGIIALVWWGTGLVGSKLIARPNATAPVTVALLQPNISQEMRWDAENTAAIFRKMIDMSFEAARRGANVIVWPESTVPLSYTETELYRTAIEDLSRRQNVDIILGSVATDPSRPGAIWNSAFLASGGTTVGHYDKIRLVPFGEYVPMRRVLFFAKKFVRAVGTFEVGTNDRPLAGRFSYGPAICYEIVFPQITRTQVRNGADVLVTITNDAWYDGTAAPAQHLLQARLRAVEDDRYLLRAATTGISAVIDPIGRVVESLPMGREGMILARVQPRSSKTGYVRFGDWFAWLAIGVVLVGMAARLRRAPRAH